MNDSQANDQLVSVDRLRYWDTFADRYFDDLWEDLESLGFPPSEGLTLRQWAKVVCPTNESRYSASNSDLSWAMANLSKKRWMSAFADVLEAILGLVAPNENPSSVALVDALRKGSVSYVLYRSVTNEWATRRVESSSSALRNSSCVAARAAYAAWCVDGEERGTIGDLAWGAMAEATKAVHGSLDLRSLLLDAWERACSSG